MINSTNGAIQEGKSAYVLGSKATANPYRRALNNPNPMRILTDERLHGLQDLANQWDSGFAVARRVVKA